uniref:Ovule protein n=1 Tax=Heterorhabditis bacteriophora TaxID=37862 RepID=A0A1I7WP77_HETBA
MIHHSLVFPLLYPTYNRAVHPIGSFSRGYSRAVGLLSMASSVKYGPPETNTIGFHSLWLFSEIFREL